MTAASTATDIDAHIQSDVLAELKWDARVTRSAAEKKEAATAAWSAPGVTSVDNQIVVSYY